MSKLGKNTVNDGIANALHVSFEAVAFTTATTKGELYPLWKPQTEGLTPQAPHKDTFIHCHRQWLSVGLVK